MSVVLHDMDKPKNCADCPFVHKEEGGTWNAYMCTRTERDLFDYVYFDRIPDDCPISAVEEKS